MTAYKTVHYLTEEELRELKYAYFEQLKNDFDDEEIPSCPEKIPDEMILEHYDGISFVDDDFFCNIEDDNYEGCGAAYQGI